MGGWHPIDAAQACDSSRRLVRNAGSMRRVALHDFTLSAPKSVSVLWAASDGPTRSAIEACQTEAAVVFVNTLAEHAAYSRQGRAGIHKTPCAVAGVLFNHRTSRADDPQLHTHCTVFNACIRVDGTTGALETLQMMQWMGAGASLYHAQLAYGLASLGFSIKRAGRLFEVAGVPQGLCRAFSQRRTRMARVAMDDLHQIRGGLDQSGTPPDAPSRRHMAAVALKTRPPKRQTAMTQPELDRIWRPKLQAWQWGQKQVKLLTSMAITKPGPGLGTSANLKARPESYTLPPRSMDSLPHRVVTNAVRYMGEASAHDILSWTLANKNQGLGSKLVLPGPVESKSLQETFTDHTDEQVAIPSAT